MATNDPTYMAAYYQANKKRIRAQHVAYRQRDPLRWKAYAREYKRNRKLAGRPCRETWSPEKYLAMILRKTCGATIEDYNNALKRQNGGCGICKAKPPFGYRKRLSMDHDHITKKFRGLLCPCCNSFLGRIADDPQK